MCNSADFQLRMSAMSSGPKTAFSQRGAKSRTGGFTLIELLVVIGIIALLASLSITAFSSVTKGFKLASGADITIAQLNLARQTAIGKNCQVEFRIYQLPDESDGGPEAAKYRAVQIFSLTEGGTRTNAIGRARFLPHSIILLSAPAASSLLEVRNPPYAVSGATVGTSFQGYSPASYNYVVFHFNPDGSTDLNPTNKWFFSMAHQQDPVQESGLPNNFVTILLDPLSGRPRIFSPN